MDIDRKARFRCRDDVVTRHIVGETLVVPIKGELADMGEVFSLNDTGAFVWSRLDGETPLGDICAGLAETFAVEAGQAWDDVAELLDALQQARLVERSPE